MKQGFRMTLLLLLGAALLLGGLAGVWLSPEVIQYAFVPPAGKTAAELQALLEDAREVLQESFPLLTLHGQRSGVTLTAGTRSRDDICLYQVASGWNEVYPRRFLAGRPVSPLEAAEGAAVIVLDERTAFQLFGDTEAVGRSVKMGETSLEVIGVAGHSRRIGETGAFAAWTPLAPAADMELTVLSAPAPADASLMTLFETTARERFGAGTLISTRKEKQTVTMILRWVLLLAALWGMAAAVRRVKRLGSRQAARIRAEKQHRYPARLIPWAAVRLLPVFLSVCGLIAAGAGLAWLAFSPARTFPEWVPESLGNFATWGDRFWSLTRKAAEPMTLRTPELAELRFWGALVRWGTVLTLMGVIRGGMAGKKRAQEKQRENLR